MSAQSAPGGEPGPAKTKVSRVPDAEVLFAAALVLAAIAYTWWSFELPFRERDRMGPGYFPRMVGVALVALCVHYLIDAWRRHTSADAPAPGQRDPVSPVAVAVIAGLSVLFISLLPFTGTWLGTVLFATAALTYLAGGRQRYLPIVVGVAIPSVLYLLFEGFLNAATLEGGLGINL